MGRFSKARDKGGLVQDTAFRAFMHRLVSEELSLGFYIISLFAVE